MDVKDLMSGIAVVIDDALDGGPASAADADSEGDLIVQIVDWFEREWDLPFSKFKSLPKEALWPNLLQAASFVLLDWRLWGMGGEKLEESTIEAIVRFLKDARKNLVPVFILTNEDLDDVKVRLPADLNPGSESGKSFVFVERKERLWLGSSVDVERLENWVHENASIYALKTWDRVLDSARAELFQAMCTRSVNWPRVFWDAYRTDNADPSASLTNLISDSLRGRMRVDAFEEEYLGGELEDVPGDELRRLIAETSFREAEFLPPDEIRCGDLYARGGGKYWLNVRPDCDCIPRDGIELEEIEVYCVHGRKEGPKDLNRRFDARTGHFNERVSESVAFAVLNGATVVFNFKRLSVVKFSEVSERRVGRLLHPYLTRIQQRYALYAQRQALPRVPQAAVPKPRAFELGSVKKRKRAKRPNERVVREKGGTASKYDGVRAFFDGLGADTHEMSIDEFEGLVRGSLPGSARRYAIWWANRRSHPQAHFGWLAAGWENYYRNLDRGMVRFRRVL